jgi:hypothetical protein
MSGERAAGRRNDTPAILWKKQSRPTGPEIFLPDGTCCFEKKGHVQVKNA